MTVRDIAHRTSQLANVLLALSLLLVLVHFRWSLELFAAGIGAHAGAALIGLLNHTPEERAGQLA